MRACFIVVLSFILFGIHSIAQDTTQHNSIKLKKAYVEADYWPRIAQKMSGSITSAELCHPKGIYTKYPSEILEFELKCSYIREGEPIISHGPDLTQEMCKIVSTLPSGAIVHFENIKARMDGKVVTLNALRFTIQAGNKSED